VKNLHINSVDITDISPRKLSLHSSKLPIYLSRALSVFTRPSLDGVTITSSSS